MTATAFVTRANANWAASAFISANVLVAAVLVRHAAWRWIAVSIAIGVIAQIALLIGDANARRISLPLLAKPDVYARTMGWRSLGEEVDKLARPAGARTIAAEQRDVVASLLYYQRDNGRVVLSWPTSLVPNHHFDLTRRLTAAAPEPVLFVTHCGSTARLARHYRNVEPLGRFETRSRPELDAQLLCLQALGSDRRDRPPSRMLMLAMNRTGLLIALAIAAVVGVVFAIWPGLDLALSGPFYDAASRRWRGFDRPSGIVRDAASWLIALVVAPAVIALVVKFLLPRRPCCCPAAPSC